MIWSIERLHQDLKTVNKTICFMENMCVYIIFVSYGKCEKIAKT